MLEIQDVAQLVIRAELGRDYRYFLARRAEDGYWEFIGGKRESGESIREAARRELDEELASVRPSTVDILEIADPYPSGVSERFHLHPVLMELPAQQAEQIERADLSPEHNDLAWIRTADFESYETLGQYTALERLGVIDDTS